MSLQVLAGKISKISSSNDKRHHLEEFLRKSPHSVTVKLLRTIYSPSTLTGVSDKTVEKLVEVDPESDDLFDDMVILRLLQPHKFTPSESSGITEHKTVDLLSELKLRTEEDKEFLKQVFKGRLNWGLDVKSINKALSKWNLELIYKPKYMRCSILDEKTIKNVSFPCIAQVKEDSEFTNIFINSKTRTVYLESRSGKPQHVRRYQEKLAKLLFDDLQVTGSWVIHGELMVKGVGETEMEEMEDGELVYRFKLSRTNNRSLISSLTQSDKTRISLQTKIASTKTPLAKERAKNELLKYEAAWRRTEDKLFVSAWDMIKKDEYDAGISHRPYKERLQGLRKLLKSSDDLSELIKPTDTTIVKEEKDIYKYMNFVLNMGEEGLIVKDLNMIWKDGTSKQQLKVKEFHTFEMKVVGYEPGTGKFKDGIGSLIVESADGEIIARASGLTLEERGLELINPDDSASGYKRIDGFELDQYNGMIVEIKANEVCKAKNSDEHSLIHPSVIRFRPDKEKADDFNYIVGLFKRVV